MSESDGYLEKKVCVNCRLFNRGVLIYNPLIKSKSGNESYNKKKS